MAIPTKIFKRIGDQVHQCYSEFTDYAEHNRYEDFLLAVLTADPDATLLSLHEWREL